MANATEYIADDGSRLYIQYEVAEGQEFIDEMFTYRTRNADRVIGVRLLHEHNGVKTVMRLCPEGTTVAETRLEDWAEPVKQFLVTVPTQPIVINRRTT